MINVMGSIMMGNIAMHATARRAYVEHPFNCGKNEKPMATVKRWT
jgi:hypothetical protein